MARGIVTEEIKAIAQRTLGIDKFTTAELRLMPYIQHQILNSKQLDPNKINLEERQIIDRWIENGWISGTSSGITMTKEFWDGMCEILWISYVVNSGGQS